MTVALSGCALLDAYQMAHYDSNEYAQITAIRAKAAMYKNDCEDASKGIADANSISEATQEFVFYSENIPNNAEGYKIAQDINDMAQGLRQQYTTEKTVSTFFCKFKYDGIERSAAIAQKTIGSKPR